MPIKPSGPLSFTEIAAEFGAGKPFALSQFYRGGQYVPNSPANQRVPTSGSIGFSNMYGATKSYYLEIGSNRENLNLYDLFVATFGNPGGLPVILDVKINPGVVIGGTQGNYAFWIGQFPNGSDITIANYGSIQGHYGARNSGGGGSCVYAAYGAQKMVFNNYGQVLAGGGGGGVGGAGGTGGPGFYDVTEMVGQSNLVPTGFAAPFVCTGPIRDCNEACVSTYGAGASCEGGAFDKNTCIQSYPIDGSCRYCKRCNKTTRYNTAGGGGGGGGAGGYGQGYGANRSGGDPGGGGSPGGQNAGYGGTGGTGGTGGDWGQAGGAGNTGDTGGNGNAGGGSPGAGGAGGGPAGNYLVKGGADFAFNNSGQVAGGLA